MLLSGVLQTTLRTTDNRDIIEYNELVTEEGAAETIGGELVYANVLRRPEWPNILSGSAGCCAHFLLISFFTISFHFSRARSIVAYIQKRFTPVCDVVFWAFLEDVAGYIAMVSCEFLVRQLLPFCLAVSQKQ